MRRTQKWRRDAYRRWARAYGERVIGWGKEHEDRSCDEDALTINFLANIVDTVHADVFKTRTLPMPMTTAGDYLAFKRAQRLGRFFEGLFAETKFFNELQLQLGLYVLICGLGWIKSTRKNGRVGAEVIPTWDIYVDDVEAKYGKPRSIFQRMLIDRYVALELYGNEPDEADDSLFGTAEERFEALEAATYDATDDESFENDYNGDQIVLTEGWHLPSGPKAKDGRHVICVDGCTLVDEPWTRATFPLRSLKSGVSLTGLHGQSVVARILPGQKEHDKLSTKLQQAHELLGVPRIIVPDDAEVSLDHINDEVGSMLRVRGIGSAVPHEWNAEPVHPSTYQYRSALREEMSAEVGVSGYAAQSQLPPGMQNTSGKALQLFDENEDGRHAIKHRLLEQFVLDVADMWIDEAEALSKEDPEFSVLVAGRGKVDELKWKEVRIDRAKLVMHISPASALSKTPAAKFDQLMKLRQSNEISSDEFRYMFEMPDLEKMNGVAISDIESIDKKIESMIFEGDYRDPSPFDNLQLAIKRGSQLYNYFDLEGGVPDARLAMIRQFIDKAVQMNTPKPANQNGASPIQGTPSVADPSAGPPLDASMAAAPPMATGTA